MFLESAWADDDRQDDDDDDDLPVSLTVEALKCNAAPFLATQLVVERGQTCGSRLKSRPAAYLGR